MGLTTAVLEGLTPLTLLGMVLVLFLLYLLSPTSGPGNEPPGPRPLPIIGNLLTLDLTQLHVDLCELSKKYGSVFTIHLGPKKLVVLAGYKTVKQALVNYADEFGERDVDPIFVEAIKGNGITFSSGESSKAMRRFSLANLRNFGMGKKGCEEMIIEESRYLVEIFEKFKGEPFDNAQAMNYCISNIVCSVLYGHRFDYEDPFFKKNVNTADTNIRLASSMEIQVYNMFPWLRWVCSPWLVNRTEIFRNTQEHLSQIWGVVEKLKDTFNPHALRGFVDSFLVQQQKESSQLGSHFHDTNLKYTVFNLFAAGTNTTAVTLRWSMLLMAKYPHIQDKVQEELSQVIGDRVPRMEDRKSLPYTDAVVHEIQRLSNIAPLSLNHIATRDFTFQGYSIKKGTAVIPLLASVLYDEEEWETPHSFNPGHFLDEEGHFIKKDAFMPFSAGRRACLGEGLARMELFLFFAILMQRFRMKPPPGVTEDDLDLTPVMEFTLNPSPHLLCAESRA